MSVNIQVKLDERNRMVFRYGEDAEWSVDSIEPKPGDTVELEHASLNVVRDSVPYSDDCGECALNKENLKGVSSLYSSLLCMETVCGCQIRGDEKGIHYEEVNE